MEGQGRGERQYELDANQWQKRDNEADVQSDVHLSLAKRP